MALQAEMWVQADTSWLLHDSHYLAESSATLHRVPACKIPSRSEARDPKPASDVYLVSKLWWGHALSSGLQTQSVHRSLTPLRLSLTHGGVAIMLLLELRNYVIWVEA